MYHLYHCHRVSKIINAITTVYVGPTAAIIEKKLSKLHLGYISFLAHTKLTCLRPLDRRDGFDPKRWRGGSEV